MYCRFNCRLVVEVFTFLMISLFVLGCQDKVGAGPMAPDFSLKDMLGNEVSLKQFRGKVVLLDFWATWCPPCRSSIPDLVKLYNENKKKGLVVLGISMDSRVRCNDERLKRFGKKLKINYPILRHDLNIVGAPYAKTGLLGIFYGHVPEDNIVSAVIHHQRTGGAGPVKNGRFIVVRLKGDDLICGPARAGTIHPVVAG